MHRLLTIMNGRPNTPIILPPSFSGGDFGTRLWEADSQRNSPTDMTRDAAGGRETVTNWLDYSGNGRHFSHGTKGNQPTFLPVGGINGKPTVQFDAASKYSLIGNSAALSLFNGRSAVTKFAVFRTGASLPASEGRLFSFSEPGGTSNTLQLLSVRSNADFLGGEKSAAGQSFSQVRTGTVVVNTNHILCGVANAAAGTYHLYRNGVLIAQNLSWQPPGNFQSADASAASIGGRQVTDDRYFTGEIGHLLVYNGALSTDNIAACFAALNTYWGGIYA